jgi:hypothetical protein
MQIEEIRRRKARGLPLSLEDEQRLDAYWKSGVSSNPHRKIRYKLGPQYAQSPFRGLVPTPPMKPSAPPHLLVCNFCGKHVGRSTATTGKTININRKEKMVSVAPTLEFEDQVIVRARKVIACPDHAHLIDKTDFDFSLE